MIKTLIFDFDGVIHDTFDFHRHKIIEFSGRELTEEDYRDMHNGNFYEFSHSITEKTDWYKYSKFINQDFVNLKIDDKIIQTLITLHEKYQLNVISSGSSENIKGCFTNNKVDNLFNEILGMDSHKSKFDKFNYLFRKYNLKKDECIFITDTLGDILEANKFGIQTIAVDFGYHDKERLKAAKPMAIVSSFKDLLKHI
jgi:HAD superfamily hydrolase (TIGR01509 family)